MGMPVLTVVCTSTSLSISADYASKVRARRLAHYAIWISVIAFSYIMICIGFLDGA